MNAPQRMEPGFENAVMESQAVFRMLLDALSQPGRIWQMPVKREAALGLAPATAEICLCILDRSTALWIDPELDSEAIGAFLKFHTGCTTTRDPATADFAILADCQRPELLTAFNPGTPEYPDRSCTVILQTDGLNDKAGVVLRGPGIESTQWLKVNGTGSALWSALRQNNALYPLGIDVVFVDGDQIVGLPRSTQIEA